jgi:hypothetical protein
LGTKSRDTLHRARQLALELLDWRESRIAGKP